MAENYLTAWVAHTDAGLLWRLRSELDLQQDATYWAGLEDWLSPLDVGDAHEALGAQRDLVVVGA